MKPQTTCAALLAVLCAACSYAAETTPTISISEFADSAHHWRDIKSTDAVILPRPNYATYKPEQIREIAANILLFQRANGGWPKNYDMCAILDDKEKAAVLASRNASDTTFDNETIHSHVAYLAKAYTLLGDPAYRAGAERGIDFMLAAQYPNGGWPQGWPNPTGYAAFITFNDGVMVGVLTVLQEAASGASEPKSNFAWLDAQRREKCRAAVERGITCLLACQYRPASGAFSGKLTGWGQQHNNRTLRPDHARKFELPSLCAEDTADIAQFLMGIEKPTPEIIAAVKAATTWLESVQINDTKIETYKTTPAEFAYHKTDKERRIVEDAKAPRIWARMYELDTDRPIFCGRDGIKRYALAEIDRDRRTGYTWYGYWPEKMLTKDYPAWLKGISKN